MLGLISGSDYDNLLKTLTYMIIKGMMMVIVYDDFKDLIILMEMLGLKETVVQMAKANGVRWYGHVLRNTLNFEVKGKKK